jgi:hypothetical protein
MKKFMIALAFIGLGTVAAAGVYDEGKNSKGSK